MALPEIRERHGDRVSATRYGGVRGCAATRQLDQFRFVDPGYVVARRQLRRIAACNGCGCEEDQAGTKCAAVHNVKSRYVAPAHAHQGESFFDIGGATIPPVCNKRG